jgi:hypothetical protein
MPTSRPALYQFQVVLSQDERGGLEILAEIDRCSKASIARRAVARLLEARSAEVEKSAPQIQNKSAA